MRTSTVSRGPSPIPSACAENGVPDFPDPEQNADGGISLGLGEGMDPESEEFQAAAEACDELVPGPDEGEAVDPEAYEALVEYSECMRENGVEDFPDPEPNGGIMMSPEMGFDPESEEFQAAAEACEDLAPGLSGSTNQSEEG